MSAASNHNAFPGGSMSGRRSVAGATFASPVMRPRGIVNDAPLLSWTTNASCAREYRASTIVVSDFAAARARFPALADLRIGRYDSMVLAHLSRAETRRAQHAVPSGRTSPSRAKRKSTRGGGGEARVPRLVANAAAGSARSSATTRSTAPKGCASTRTSRRPPNVGPRAPQPARSSRCPSCGSGSARHLARRCAKIGAWRSPSRSISVPRAGLNRRVGSGAARRARRGTPSRTRRSYAR